MKKMYVWIVAMILFCFVCTGLFFSLAPDQIPSHYNIQGEVDRWGSKYEFLVFPCINLVSGALMTLVGRYEGKRGRDTNEKIVAGVSVWMLIVFNALWIFFMVKAIDPSTAQKGLGAFFLKGISMLAMVLFVVMGNIIPKARRNSYMGLRTKWSMANDVCWQKSQRLGGYTMVISGIAGIILLGILPAKWTVWVILGIMAALLLVTLPGSYLIYIKEMK